MPYNFGMGILSWLLISLCWGAEVKFSAQADYESFYYTAKLPKPTRQNDQVIHLEPALDIKYNKRSRMIFKPHLRANVSTDESPENFFFNAKESYWEIKHKAFRSRIGSNIHSWGVMDGYSPLDVVNGRTFFNPLAGEKRGAAALDFLYEFKYFQIQALYIPHNSRTLLPSTDSRWLPRDLILNTTSGDDTLLLPRTFQYYYPGTEGASEAVQNNFGARVTSRFANWDFSAVFFEGSSITPQVRPLITGFATGPNTVQATSDIGLIPVYYRQQTSGASIVWAPTDLIIRLESSYGVSRNNSTFIPAYIWQSALGFEKPINLGSTSLTLITQFYHAENKDPIDNLVSSSSRLFDSAGVIGARWGYSDDGAILLTSLYNFKDDSFYVHFDWGTRFWEKYRIGLAADMIEGASDTLLGTYNKNDRLIAQLSYFF